MIFRYYILGIIIIFFKDFMEFIIDDIIFPLLEKYTGFDSDKLLFGLE